jgi:hypothetical protein
LYYQFSVFKDSNLIGRIYIGANKELGQSVRLVEFYPKPFNAVDVMKKSIEIAKKEYPAGEIKSTIMVVYDYPEIGSMTMVKDKTTGVEYRIFVDTYTLDMVPDKPTTETQLGVWSMYEKISKDKIEENINKWQKSDELVKFVEQAAINKGVNINLPVTEENIKKLSGYTIIAATDVERDLGVPSVILQDNYYYCAPATAQMLDKFYNNVKPSQDSIYQMMGGVAPNGISLQAQLTYYKSSNGLNKPNSYLSYDLTFNTAVSKINNYRPFRSATSTHARVCHGYKQSGSTQYLVSVILSLRR